MQRSKTSNRQPPQSQEEAAGLSSALEHNIRAMVRRRDRETATAGFQERLAETITAFTGSMTFVYLHLAAVAFWMGVTTGWLPVMEPWDPSFVILAMAASVEAIFLTSFVLISQNRMAENDARRADLNLQISLLCEPGEASSSPTSIHPCGNRRGPGLLGGPFQYRFHGRREIT